MEIYIQITVYRHPSPRTLCRSLNFNVLLPRIQSIQFDCIWYIAWDSFPFSVLAFRFVHHWTMSQQNHHFRHSSFKAIKSVRAKTSRKTIYCNHLSEWRNLHSISWIHRITDIIFEIGDRWSELCTIFGSFLFCVFSFISFAYCVWTVRDQCT